MSDFTEEPLPYGGTSLFTIQYMKRSVHFNMNQNHYHPYFEMYYLLSGERNYFIKDNIYSVRKGDLVFVNEHELHKTTADGISPEHERIVIYFRRSFFGEDQELLLDPLSPFLAESPVLTLNIHDQKYVEDLLRRLLAELENQERNFETCIKSLYMELFIYVLRCNEKHLNRTVASDKLRHTRVSEIIRFINQNYHDHLTLTELSGRFYISPHYLSRIFKHATGFSFVEYLTTLRIKEAQKLLRETNWKMSRISKEVGFDDFAHFGRVFKKVARCTPLQYRKMNGG